MQVQKISVGYWAEHVENGVLLQFEFSRINEKDQQIVGFLKIKATIHGETYTLYTGNFNVTSPDSRKRTARYVEKLSESGGLALVSSMAWDVILEAFARGVISAHFEPKRAVKLRILEHIPELKFLLYPLIPEETPVLIYAPGGGGKSLLSLYIGMLVQNGYDFHGNRIEAHNVLFCDWELNEKQTEMRFNQIVPPEHIEKREAPHYLQCSLVLRDELPNIVYNVKEYDVKLVILDSAAMATGGDLIDASSVVNFFQNIRKIIELGTSVLIITHVNKAQREKNDISLPVGSVFFENLARLTWELRFQKDPKNHHTVFSLYNRKSNFRQFDPIAFKIVWQDGMAIFEPADPEQLSSTPNTNEDIILATLRISGEMSTKDLVEETAIPKEQLSVYLHRLKEKGLVTQPCRGRWLACC